jgi:site-specific DNA-methyltransferase (adenine-specific)
MIINDDVLTIRQMKNNSIDLIVTSPPYNVNIRYGSHDDGSLYDEYLTFSGKWMARCYRWLADSGRFCLNIPLDKNKGGQESVGADLTVIAKEAGFSYHATIVWNEGNISRRTAWGSWMSPSAPYVIAPVELIVVLYKGSWKRSAAGKKSDIKRQEFMDWTNGLWTFSGESKKKVNHPAPFPVELPVRCMKLFSYIDDLVLDPFMGSGSTLVAACRCNRRAVGVDLDKEYCRIALDRVRRETGT